MRFKQGVDQKGVHPAVWYALGIAEMIYALVNRELVVTSLKDGVHSSGSLHYQGRAADLRTRHLSKQETTDTFSRLKNKLDYWVYDVILEKDHIHLEYDPKGDETWQVEVV